MTLNEKELKELLTTLTVNQNEMAKKMIGMSEAILELQELARKRDTN